MVKDKLAENAVEHFEDGESWGQQVTVRRGTIKQQNHALVATDRHLYAFRLAWPGQTNIAETLLKLPIDDVELEVDVRKVVVRERSSGTKHEWKRLHKVGKADDPGPLQEYLAARASSGAGPA